MIMFYLQVDWSFIMVERCGGSCQRTPRSGMTDSIAVEVIWFIQLEHARSVSSVPEVEGILSLQDIRLMCA